MAAHLNEIGFKTADNQKTLSKPQSSSHNVKNTTDTSRTLTSCSNERLSYRIPLLSLLPPLTRDDSDLLDNDYTEKLTWSDAYKCARSFLLETQKERQQSKALRIKRSLRGPKTTGEISLQIGQLQNAGKKIFNNAKKPHMSNGLCYEVHGCRPAGWWVDYAHGIPTGQWLYPWRPPNTCTPKKTSPREYFPQRRTTEKTSRKNVEVLKPWVVHDSKEEKQFEMVMIEDEDLQPCESQSREESKEMFPFDKTVYLPHHR